MSTEIVDWLRENWPKAHAGHPGLDLERGECTDCPHEKARLEHEAFKELLMSTRDKKPPEFPPV